MFNIFMVNIFSDFKRKQTAFFPLYFKHMEIFKRLKNSNYNTIIYIPKNTN